MNSLKVRKREFDGERKKVATNEVDLVGMMKEKNEKDEEILEQLLEPVWVKLENANEPKLGRISRLNTVERATTAGWINKLQKFKRTILLEAENVLKGNITPFEEGTLPMQLFDIDQQKIGRENISTQLKMHPPIKEKNIEKIPTKLDFSSISLDD